MNKWAAWFRQAFNDGQLLLLLFLVVLAITAVSLFASMLAPAIAAVVIAFLLDGPTSLLIRRGVRPILAQAGVFLAFLMVAVIIILEVFPPLFEQIGAFLNEVPRMGPLVYDIVLQLQGEFPELIKEDSIREWISSLTTEITGFGPSILAISLSGVAGAVTLIVYLVLVPVMVFFFLKDKDMILAWCASFMPGDQPMLRQIWSEATMRAGDYARGKIYEILIIAALSFIVFQIIGIRYATLLSVSTGLSVLLPFIGAAGATVPVALVALLQWGWGGDMWIALGAYFAIQAFDGNILNPLLFSEVVKLHPNAIILAILIFGGIWGFWGLFFAIPLATVANAVIRAWKEHTAKIKAAHADSSADS